MRVQHFRECYHEHHRKKINMLSKLLDQTLKKIEIYHARVAVGKLSRISCSYKH
jgi:hypothetical protein